ncbi:MAG: SUMF1/EgtB/PvdO family nonheme iron enzyme [Candidatus Krumholzibacteriota bacterium]|nr:SUMF1/EgtB/PvdO family nonheme iron enzyme [Candidatus Krumholzibacteriota bacterium]
MIVPARRILLLTLPLLLASGCFWDNDGGVEPPPPGFSYVPAGSYRMGEPGLFDPYEGTRRVSLRRGFIIAQTELTVHEALPLFNAGRRHGEAALVGDVLYFSETGDRLLALQGHEELLYDAAGDSLALRGGADPGLPLRRVTWYGAAALCDWRNQAEGLPRSYVIQGLEWVCGPGGNPYDAMGWRLPTEAEWEYAARYPDHRQYSWGDRNPDCATCNGRSSPAAPPCEAGPLPVASYSPQGDAYLFLSDLAGNLREWVQDWYGDWIDYEPLVDPVDVNAYDLEKGLRGGSHDGPFEALSGWYRDRAFPDEADGATGLRMVRTWY